ncbi:nipsnap family protein [Catenaria anguillulae PL171]|uniref:Nipsnap family protein n=1 Tax=Catenaria anguillulae PL171 TaxID=765915 RepID=A0A1Y2HJ38_9FUNG|nr:nipsnap family protein [Catenaria anguillulae PL171]
MVCREFGFWAPEDFHAMDGIYELRSYQLHPGKLLEWGQHWKKGVEARRQYTTPIGAWFSQLGPLHCVHHLWYYKNLQERQMSRERAWESEAWAKAVKLTVPLLTHLDAAILRRIG